MITAWLLECLTLCMCAQNIKLYDAKWTIQCEIRLYRPEKDIETQKVNTKQRQNINRHDRWEEGHLYYLILFEILEIMAFTLDRNIRNLSHLTDLFLCQGVNCVVVLSWCDSRLCGDIGIKHQHHQQLAMLSTCQAHSQILKWMNVCFPLF